MAARALTVVRTEMIHGIAQLGTWCQEGDSHQKFAATQIQMMIAVLSFLSSGKNNF